jgi:copper chaperone
MSTATISVPGIHCDHCKSSIEGALGALDGVELAEVSVPDRTVRVDFDESQVDLDAIQNAIEEQGYDLQEKA